MKEAKKLDLGTIIELYIQYCSIDKVASELDCTRQHIYNEITRQTKVSGIKQLMSDMLRSKK